MKQLLFTILLLLNTICYSLGQCTFEELFPLPFGITKFETIIKIDQITGLKKGDLYKWMDDHNIQRPKDLDINETKEWEQITKENKDSVLRIILYYDYKNNPCFLTDQAFLQIWFIDDKLFAYHIYLGFPKEKLKSCIENQNRIMELIKEKLPLVQEDKLVNKAGEQKGSIFLLFKNEAEAKSKKPVVAVIRMANVLNSLDYSIEVYYENYQIVPFTNQR